MGSKGSRKQKRFRATVVGLIEKYTIHYYVAVAVLALAMIPLSIWVFPSTTLFLTVIVLFIGFLSAMGDLSSILIDLHQNDEIDSLQDDVGDLQEDEQ